MTINAPDRLRTFMTHTHTHPDFCVVCRAMPQEVKSVQEVQESNDCQSRPGQDVKEFWSREPHGSASWALVNRSALHSVCVFISVCVCVCPGLAESGAGVGEDSGMFSASGC